MTFFALLTTFFLLQHPGTPGPDQVLKLLYYPEKAEDGLTVTATRKNGDTIVRLGYPPRPNVWTCTIMRKPSEPDYKPMWCFIPASTRTETFTIPRWPPVPSTDLWEVKAFVQWDLGNEFGYLETEWVVVN